MFYMFQYSVFCILILSDLFVYCNNKTIIVPGTVHKVEDVVKACQEEAKKSRIVQGDSVVAATTVRMPATQVRITAKSVLHVFSCF
jgi:hypothetical protein